MAAKPPILIWQPGGGTPPGEVAVPRPPITNGELTQLIEGQNYIDVVFDTEQVDNTWIFLDCSVINTADSDPLNIAPGITTVKTSTGFRLYLNGMPDSDNYFLSWAISGVNIPPPVAHPATSYTLSGPASGAISVASSVFTVALPAGGTVVAPVTVTPSAGGGGGTFTPTSVSLDTGAPSATFTYTPASYGAKTISTTNNGLLTDPASVVYTCVATTYTLTGPSTGVISVVSTNFTVALPAGGVVSGTVTVTPHDAGTGTAGTFTPTTVALTTVAPSATFTYTPASVGAKTISVTNDGSLTNPGNLTYTVGTGGLADGDPVSTWPDVGSGTHFYDATQTGSSRPIYKTNIINSKPVVRFTVAGTSSLVFAHAVAPSASFTFFVVMKATATNKALACIGSSAVGGPFGPLPNSDTQLYIGDPTAVYVAGTNDATWHVWTDYAPTGIPPTLYKDGTSTGVPTVAGGGTTGNYDVIGRAGGGYSDGDIAELIVYSALLGTTDRQNVEKYLGTKYAITVAAGSAVDPSTVTGLVAWFKADSL